MEFLKQTGKILADYYPQLLSGVGYTMLIALTGTVAGLLIGLLVGVVRTAPLSQNRVLRALHRVLNGLLAAYIEIFRSTPMMVQAMVIFWGYAFLNNGQTLPLIPAGIFIVSINTGAYMAEIVRGGIISVDRGQTEGAYSVGMTHAQAMVHVILPQALRNILPSVSNEFVINIKDTSVLNVIGVTELYYFAGIIKRQSFETFQTYLVVCAIYFVLTFAVTRLLRLLEIGERLPQRLPVVLRAQDEAEARLGQREAAVERAVRPARAGQKLRRQIQNHALIRRARRGLRPVDAALRDQDHVARLERIAPPLESVARRTAEEEDQLVKRVVMPVQLLLHRSFQVEQAEILAQISALHIFRLRHGLPPSQGYLCLKGVSET